MGKYLVKDIVTLFEDNIKEDEEFCHKLWSSLTNVTWVNKSEKAVYKFSFRYAGGIISDIRCKGSYTDWYMESPYGVVDKYIALRLSYLGWNYSYDEEEEN